MGIEDPEHIVAECCAAGTPAVAAFRARRLVVRAAFAGCGGGRVDLRLAESPADPPKVDETCHVTFQYHDRSLIFAGGVVDYEPNATPPVLSLAAPESVTSEGTRAAFRVPAGHDDAPEVDVLGDDGVPWHASLVNLSLTGMYLRCPVDHPPLMPDQTLELTIRMGEAQERVAGVVCRVEHDGVAVSFPDPASRDAESPVRHVLGALERDWHARLRG